MKIAASAALKTQPNATKLPIVEFKEEVPYPAQLLPSFLAALIVHPFGTGRAVGTRGAIARMRIIGGFVPSLFCTVVTPLGDFCAVVTVPSPPRGVNVR
jgi:hypothetical protein